MALSKRLQPNDAEPIDRKPSLYTSSIATSVPASAMNRHVMKLRKRASPAQRAAMKNRKEAQELPLPQVQTKGSWEVPRKTLHYSIGFAVLYFYTHDGDPVVIYRWLSLFFAIVVGADLLRFSYRPFNRQYIRILGPLMRNHEVEAKFNGVAYYVAGCTIVLALFPKDIASLSIVYLSWCDPTASICGRLWGQYTPRFNNKSLAGSLGAAVAGVLVTYGFFSYMVANGFDHPSWSPDAQVPLTLVALYGGTVAAFAEGIDLFGWDDNLTIPVLSAAMLWGLLVLGGLGIAA